MRCGCDVVLRKEGCGELRSPGVAGLIACSKGGYARLMLRRPPLDAMPNSMRSKSSSSLSSNLHAVGLVLVVVLFVVCVVCVDCSMLG